MYGMHSSWDDDSDGKKEKKKGIETERELILRWLEISTGEAEAAAEIFT